MASLWDIFQEEQRIYFSCGMNPECTRLVLVHAVKSVFGVSISISPTPINDLNQRQYWHLNATHGL